MRADWLWDRKTTPAKARCILKNPNSPLFPTMAALLLSRKNEPQEVFKNYLDPTIFCKYWQAIKRKMRQDKWIQPRIIFWQAVYEKLIDRYGKKGISFKREKPARKPFCEKIGKEMADIRRRQGLSQKELARKIGISQQLISRIEKGGGNISLGTLTNIAHALDTKVEISFVKA